MKKNFKSILFSSIVLFSLFAGSCKKDNAENLGPHLKMSMSDFYNDIYKPRDGNNLQILDYRSDIDFKAGHIWGAKNFEATAQNTKENNGPFATFVLANFDTSRPIFLYGKGGDDLYFGNFVPGRVSKIGFGQQNTIFLTGGWDAWKDLGGPIGTGAQ